MQSTIWIALHAVVEVGSKRREFAGDGNDREREIRCCDDFGNAPLLTERMSGKIKDPLQRSLLIAGSR
jgi:hypothetical protein